jgi:hypothetical protein
MPPKIRNFHGVEKIFHAVEKVFHGVEVPEKPDGGGG